MIIIIAQAICEWTTKTLDRQLDICTLCTNIKTMATTVSVSEFRRNLSDWLERAREGEKVIVRDEREREDVAEVRPAEKKNWDEIMKAVEETRGMWADIPEREWRASRRRIERAVRLPVERARRRNARRR